MLSVGCSMFFSQTRDSRLFVRKLPVVAHLGQLRLRRADADRAVQHFAVAELADDLQDLGPGGVHPLVDLLVGLDRHHEFELVPGHLALLGAAAVVAAAAPRAAAALQARVLAAVVAAATLLAGVTAFSGRLHAALQAAAAVDEALAAVGALAAATLVASAGARGGRRARRGRGGQRDC